MWMLSRDHAYNRATAEAIESVATDTIVIAPPENARLAYALPVLAWRDQERFEMYRARPGTVGPLLDAMFHNGYDDVTVVHPAAMQVGVPPGIATVVDATPGRLRARGIGVHVVRRGNLSEQH